MRTIVLTAAFLLVCLRLAPALAASCAARSGTLVLDAASLYWEEHGDPSAPPLLLLHGFGESMSVWAPYVPALCTRYDVVLLDLRGHGRSTNRTDRFSFRAASDDVLALMDQLHHRYFRALGVSAGAIVLLHVAVREPARVVSLALVGAAPYLPPQARERIRRIAADKDTLPYLRRFATRGDEQAASLNEQFSALASSVDDPAFTPPQLATITAPTLIVQGDRDEFFPVEMALELYRSIPNAYLRIYPNGGHEPIYEPAAVADFTAQLLDFLAGRWASR
jgi:pimeloyl-ACP methyl ester carboxylesterase